MQDNSDIRIKRQWETSPFRRNTPCIDPERECDAFSKAFCDAFCNEFCGKFLEEFTRGDRAGEGPGEANESEGMVPVDVSVNIVDADNNRLETCRTLCCRICNKVCRRAYWEVIGKGPMA